MQRESDGVRATGATTTVDQLALTQRHNLLGWLLAPWRYSRRRCQLLALGPLYPPSYYQGKKLLNQLLLVICINID